MRQARTCARLTTSRAIIYLRARAVRVVVIVTECLTPIREWCNLSLVETKQPTEIAHMKIELTADQLLKIDILLTQKCGELLEKGAVHDDEKWDEYKKLSSLSKKFWAAYQKADRELEKARK